MYCIRGNSIPPGIEMCQGSQVSVVIAELVMQEVVEKVLETSPVTSKWWRRYVDDSNACIKRECFQIFSKPLKLDKRQYSVNSGDAYNNYGQEQHCLPGHQQRG